MTNLAFTLPVLSALLGWGIARLMLGVLFRPTTPRTVAGFRLQGLFPKHRERILTGVIRFLYDELIRSAELENRILSPQNLQQIMPEVETHIDHFLKVKLKVAMPMIGMLIGERTISQLKEIFIRELEELFPVILKSYIGSVKSDFDLQHFTNERIRAYSGGTLDKKLEQIIQPLYRPILLGAAVLGFTVGLLNLLFFVLSNHQL